MQSLDIREIPLQITSDGVAIFSILRTLQESSAILILVPAMTGNRLGPQNVYVEIARQLARNNIACLCLDLPPAGDSYDYNIRKFHGNYSNNTSDKYSFYLELVIHYLKTNFNYKTIYIGSISVGCIPVLQFSITNKISGVVLLSPNHLENNTIVNVKNFKSYYYKVFKKETWLKFLTFKIDFRKVFLNLLSNPGKKMKMTSYPIKGVADNKLNDMRILCVLGEKDPSLYECLNFWKGYVKNNGVKVFNHKVIKGSDHSFFGWQYKKDVCDTILNWLIDVEASNRCC